MSIIIRMMMIAWMAMKAISWQLWLPDRTFPQVPFVFLTPVLQVILFVSFFTLAAGLLYKPLNAALLFSFIITETITLLGDEVRWLPWEYQFLFILIAVLINRKSPRFAIQAIVLILASTYIYSGLQKINGNFLFYVWQRLILIRFFRFPASLYNNRAIYWSGLIIPLFEITSGVLILLSKQRKWFVSFPIFIHLFVILFLSPLGIRYNYSIIPWNVAMALFIYILFIRQPVVFSFKNIFYRYNVAISFVWIVLPLAGIFGYWDKFFSSGVYTGNVPYMVIYLSDVYSIPKELQPFVVRTGHNYQGRNSIISIHDWGMNELKVAIPPQRRIYKGIEQAFNKKYSDLQPLCVISDR